MKKLLLTAAAILATLNMFAQGSGSLNFSSVGAPDAKKVRLADGSFASTGYVAALYWGSATETDERNLVQAGNTANFLTGVNAGCFAGSGRTLTYSSPSVNGSVLTFQVRAWQGAAGSSYDNATVKGSSGMFTMKTKDESNPLETKPNLWEAPGFVGFTVVPEPSVIGLGLLGAGALLMLRRRK
jgi:hypothetical protein